MDDLDDLQASEFITDSEDQDSLDERIDSEQRHCNQQLWASFQNAACCITKLYKERAQPNLSPWVPFQNAASNLTTLYKDCIESQRRFARIGYQAGKRKKSRELAKLIKKYKVPSKQHATAAAHTTTDHSDLCSDDMLMSMGQQHNHQLQHNPHEASILAVNQLNLGCDDLTPSHSMQAQPSNQSHTQAGFQANTAGANAQQQPLSNMHISASNNEDDLVTFQQALVQPAAVRGNKLSQTRRTCPNSSNYHTNRMVADPKSEEERLLELNQFLSEEYHRHVGSKKRSCSTLGGSPIKRLRE